MHVLPSVGFALLWLDEVCPLHVDVRLWSATRPEEGEGVGRGSGRLLGLLALVSEDVGIAVCAEELIDPSETGSVVEEKGGVVVVVELGAAIEWEVVEDVEGQVVATVSDDGVELAQLNPDVKGEEVRADDHGWGEGGGAEDDDLGPVRVGSAQAEGCLELVVHLVDLLIQPLDVEHAVTPILEPVLTDEEEGHLPGKFPKRRPRTIVMHTQEVEDRPANHNHRNDHNHIVEEDVQNAGHIVHHRVHLRRLDLVALQPAHLLHNDENGSSPNVRERHERIEDHEDVEGLILRVQSRPQTLNAAPIQLYFVSILLEEKHKNAQKVSVL